MKVVFLDRDGIINKYPGHGDYVKTIKDFHLFPGIFKALKRLKEAKYKLFIISNQACVGRGIITQKKLDQITAKLIKAAVKEKIKFDGIFYCTHKPDERCACRKPEIGNIKKALALSGNRLSSVKNGYFIGDTDKDIEAGFKAGLKTILVETGRDRLKDFKEKSLKPQHVTSNMEEAVDLILKYESISHPRNRRRRA